MKSIFTLLIICLFSFSSFAQKEKETLEQTGRIKTDEGEFIDMYGPMSIANDYIIQYKDENGKNKTIKEKKTDWVYWGGHVWFYHVREKSSKDFLEMMAMNERYKLFYIEINMSHCFYIFDMHDNLVGEEILIKNKNSFTKVKFNSEGSHEAYNTIKKYFGDCPDLMSELELQLKNEVDLYCKGFISCPGAQELKSLLK